MGIASSKIGAAGTASRKARVAVARIEQGWGSSPHLASAACKLEPKTHVRDTGGCKCTAIDGT